MYISLYRRYRPQYFSEIIGQSAAVNLLRGSILRKNVSHAYLFSGPRGSGKTTLARILSRAVNCVDLQDDGEPCGKCTGCLSISSGESLDVIEIDGASNNGVDEIRELKSHVNLSPFSAKYKIYIIDEVHMLSLSAFNALLKTLEEPPDYVIFVLATTEPHKVPVTIRSRCQHIPFHRISEKEIAGYLPVIAEREGRTVEQKASMEIARQADGALRDALSLLEQAISASEGEINLEIVSGVLSGGSYADMEALLKKTRKEAPSGLAFLEDILARGASPSRILEYLYILSRNLWIASKWGEKPLESIGLSEDEILYLGSEKRYWSDEGLFRLMDICMQTVSLTRTGMRSDVLAGIVFSHLIDALNGEVHEPEATLETKEEENSIRENIISEEKKKKKGSVPPVKCKSFKTEANALQEPQWEKAPMVGAIEKEAGRTGDSRAGMISDPEWQKLMNKLAESMINLYACLINSSVFSEKDRLIIEFDSSKNRSFSVLSSPANAYALQQAVEDELDAELSIVMRCSEREVSFPFEGPGDGVTEHITPDVEEERISQESLFRTPETSGSDTEKLNYISSEMEESVPSEDRTENKANDKAFAGILDDVVKMTNGEVLYVKDQDITEAETAEEIENGEGLN